MRPPHDLAALIDVHATEHANVRDILNAAVDAEADAVFLTDHDIPQARRDGYEGWHQGVLLLVGIEIRPQTMIELWSQERVTDHPPALNVAEWDRLCQRRRVVAIGGLGAHQTGLHPTEGFFRMLRTHLLCERPPTGDLHADRKLVLDALRRGRCFLGRDSLANTRNFRFFADGPNGFLPMGAEAPADDWTLHVRLPMEAELRLIRDGLESHCFHRCRRLDLPCAEPGVYRVDARLRVQGRVRTWIVSNPLYLRAR
jgi:hypothetical protein